MSDDKPTAYAMIPMDEYERLNESAARADEGSPIIHWDLVARALNLKGINASDVGGILMLMKHDAQRWKAVADFFELGDDKSIDAALKLWMDQSRTDKALYESTVVALEECQKNIEMVYDAVGSGKDGSIIDVIGALRADAQRWKAVADFFELGDDKSIDIHDALKKLQSDARKWEIVAKKTLETPGYIHNERSTQTVHMAQKTYDDLISCWHEKNLSLKADAEKWRDHIGAVAPNPDGTVSLSGIGDQQKKDMELGMMVRKMPKGASLRVLSDGWAAADANHVLSYNKNTPEEALKAILNAVGIEVE